jgi:hypothetical protein
VERNNNKNDVLRQCNLLNEVARSVKATLLDLATAQQLQNDLLFSMEITLNPAPFFPPANAVASAQ